MAYQGTLVHNIMKHSAIIQPYRADGLAAKTDSPQIGPGEWRLINNDHIGDADYFFIHAFMKDSVVPERIDVYPPSWSKSGSAGLSRNGASSSMAAAVVKLTLNAKTGRFESEEKFLLEAATGTVSFNPEERSEQQGSRANMVVWRLLYAPDQASRPSDDEVKGW